MFISPAFAQTAGGAGFDFVQILPLVLIVVVFYFLLFRPQQQKRKAHESMISSLHRGDKVVTGGGLMGRVTKVLDGGRVMVEIAENVRVQVASATIASVVAKPEPVSDPEKKDRGARRKEDDKKRDSA